MNNTTSHQGHVKSLRAASIGNALEWFDWTLYATFSVYLASNLFDKTDARSAMLATLAVFAVGFVARPVGGWLFGRLSDRLGVGPSWCSPCCCLRSAACLRMQKKKGLGLG